MLLLHVQQTGNLSIPYTLSLRVADMVVGEAST